MHIETVLSKRKKANSKTRQLLMFINSCLLIYYLISYFFLVKIINESNAIDEITAITVNALLKPYKSPRRPTIGNSIIINTLNTML